MPKTTDAVVIPDEMRQYADAIVVDAWRLLSNLRDLVSRRDALRHGCEVLGGWTEDSDGEDGFQARLKAVGYEEINDMLDLIAGWLVDERQPYRRPFEPVDESRAARKAHKIMMRRWAD